MEASQCELFTLKGLLESFAQSTGLRVNYKKSCLAPLNLSDDKAQLLARVFGCKLESLPFTYLGLGTTKPRVEHFGFLMNKTERKLSATSHLQPADSCWKIAAGKLSSFLPAHFCNVYAPNPSDCTRLY